MARESKSSGSEESGFYGAYAGFAKTLRAWLIAYGIGAPVIFLTNQELWTKLANSGKAPCVGILFATGVTLQVLGAILYKTAMWYLYVGETKTDFRKTLRHRTSDWISECYCLEFTFDILSITSFVLASIIASLALAKS